MTPRLRVIIVAIALLCLVRIALLVRRREIWTNYLVAWSMLSVVSLPIVVFPGIVDRVSEWLGIYYPPATVFLLAVVILFLISVHFSREISRLEERTRVLAEELALALIRDPRDPQSPRPPTQAPPTGEVTDSGELGVSAPSVVRSEPG